MPKKKTTYKPRVFEGRIIESDEIGAHPQANPRIRAHRGHLRSHARANRGPVAGAGAQAAAEEAVMALTMRPTGLGSEIDKDRQDFTVYTGDWAMSATAVSISTPRFIGPDA